MQSGSHGHGRRARTSLQSLWCSKGQGPSVWPNDQTQPRRATSSVAREYTPKSGTSAGVQGQARARSWIAIWMACANLAALGKTAGILNASALAVVFRFTEVLLVAVDRVFEECNGQAQKHRNGDRD